MSCVLQETTLSVFFSTHILFKTYYTSLDFVCVIFCYKFIYLISYISEFSVLVKRSSLLAIVHVVISQMFAKFIFLTVLKEIFQLSEIFFFLYMYKMHKQIVHYQLIITDTSFLCEMKYYLVGYKILYTIIHLQISSFFSSSTDLCHADKIIIEYCILQDSLWLCHSWPFFGMWRGVKDHKPILYIKL